jgi:hypothetical protein
VSYNFRLTGNLTVGRVINIILTITIYFDLQNGKIRYIYKWSEGSINKKTGYV